MTQQVLLVQGGGKGAHDEWDNKIAQSLERELGWDYTVRYPRMPHETDPTYAEWSAALRREFGKLDDVAVLVGHSIGGTILLRTLADDPPTLTIGGIFLIAAPFVGDGGWRSEDVEPLADLGAKLPERTPIYLYHGSQDETAPLERVHLHAKSIPQAIVRELPGRDHQLNNDMSEVAADIRRTRTHTRRDHMLSENDAIATVAVKNLETAKHFYEETLGLTKVMENEEVLAFTTGKSTLFVYRSQFAGTNKATAVTFVTQKVDDLVRTLRDRGVTFEHYDLPQMTRQGDIHVAGPMKTAWFKDPDGNIFSLVTPPTIATREGVTASARGKS